MIFQKKGLLCMLRDKIKDLIKSNNKKTMENLVVFLVLLIITIISINIIWKTNSNDSVNTQDQNYTVLADNINISNNTEINEYNLEKELEDILGKIQGVGKVQVLITYSESSEIVVLKNEQKNLSKTEESDSNRWYKNDRIY